MRMTRKVREDMIHGRPYIQFLWDRYSSQKLCATAQLIGNKLVLRPDPEDLATIDAYYEDGRFFDTLHR